MPCYDVLIQGARVVDGTGNPWFYGDVALSGDLIAAVAPAGRIPREGAAEVVEASGLVVCPGFIDIQSHSIAPLMMDGRSLSKITQGVTTEIMGEGWTPAPFGGKRKEPIGFEVYARRLPEWVARARGWTRFGDWLEAMVERGVSPNIGSFLAGGTLREHVMGMAMRAPTEDELGAMKRLTAEAMADGAFGVAYALIYPPDAYTATPEISEVCKVVSEYSGLYISHIRSEAEEIFGALEEAFAVGRGAELPVEIYHLKAAGKANWDKMPRVIAMINEARAAGLDVSADMYPYPASGTGLSSVLPPWAAAEGRLFENLRDPAVREKIRGAVLEPDGSWEAMASRDGPEIVMPIGFQKPENQAWVGKRLSEIAAMRKQHWVDAVFDLLMSEEQRISTIYFSMAEENLKRQLTEPWMKISTDAGGYDPAWGQEMGPTHPRAYGSYPRVLGKYVREEGVLALEDAVRKMSSAVADRLGLRDRGLLRRGMAADVVLFDPATVLDRATFEASHRLSVGVRDVWVNGARVLADGLHSGATPGRVVRNTK
ncbi:MAG: D-aminoacylase [Deinococcota bacterium]|nr:D-aminoacylase [Deinococcota bacterium]